MRGLYLECSTGAAGDMILAALLDCGLSKDELKTKESILPLKGYTFEGAYTIKKSIRAFRVKISVTEKQPLRNLPGITALIDKTLLSTHVL